MDCELYHVVVPFSCTTCSHLFEIFEVCIHNKVVLVCATDIPHDEKEQWVHIFHQQFLSDGWSVITNVQILLMGAK